MFSLWCIQYIAVELEQPFGRGVDDLDLASAQEEFNESLVSDVSIRSAMLKGWLGLVALFLSPGICWL